MSRTEMEDSRTVQSERSKVHIKCRSCGQVYVLRGTRDEYGHIETGFKMCSCDSTDVEITVMDNH